MPKRRESGKIERLQGLAASPAEQIDYALQLVESESHPDVVQAALDVLAGVADLRVRSTLLAAYARCSEGGERRDPGCYLRVAIMRALRPLATRDDAAPLERAVTTYEFMAPGRSEVAASLRSTALVTLNEVDGTLAGYHAVRVLTDQHTSIMSGEPAVTAAQVLASQGQALPLYSYVLREEGTISDVVGECLRNLTDLPVSLLPALVQRYHDSRDEIVLLGLFDLVLSHEAHARFDDMVLDFLRETRLYNIYRYVVSTVIAHRREGLIGALEASATREEDRFKAEILRDALSLR